MECNDDSIQKWNFASQRKLNLRENERNKVRFWLKLRKRHISELQAKETAEVERERDRRLCALLGAIFDDCFT